MFFQSNSKYKKEDRTRYYIQDMKAGMVFYNGAKYYVVLYADKECAHLCQLDNTWQHLYTNDQYIDAVLVGEVIDVNFTIKKI